MKKIQTKSSEAKRQKRNQKIIGVVLLFVMFGSVFGIIVNSFGQQTNNSRIIYNEFEFVNQNGFWSVEKNDLNWVFKYNPQEVEEINFSINGLEKYANRPLYIYSEDSDSDVEVYKNLIYYNNFVQRMQEACPDLNNSSKREFKCDENWPIKNCDNNFVIIIESNETKITQENNCVIIEGKKENLLTITDEFLFKLSGIRSA